MQMWVFFIAHAGPDVQHARALHDALTSHDNVDVFLDARQLAPGEPWQMALKKALSFSRVSVVLISQHSDDSWYQQEEVALAIDLVRDEARAHTIVPVFLPGVDTRNAPYGLKRVHAIVLDRPNWDPVAQELLGILRQRPKRTSTQRSAGAIASSDELWSGIEPGVTGRSPRDVHGLGQRVLADGDDLVREQRGTVVDRITRADFESRLRPGDLELIEVLERSMEVQKAIYKRAYPIRTLSPNDRQAADVALAAMAEDLKGVLDLVERAGLWLDDHYIFVRNLVEDHLR